VITVPGTDISIIPPAYFKPYVNEGKFGFLHQGAGSSITIQEMAGTPFALVTQSLTKEYFESQGITFITKEDIKTKYNKDGTLFLVGFKVKSKDGKTEVEYERIMYFTGTYNRTIWVNANYPKVARNVLFNVLKTSVLSIQYGE
jgi:pyruvate/2-oxoglutarate dehydrogenase complex dihydrolipoamide dehydrogenase (E3) component